MGQARLQQAITLQWRRSPIIPILGIQLAFLVLTGLGSVGVDIPVVRPLVALVYLLFVPGALILLILDVRNLNVLEGLLYSVGLSLATIMVTGLALNTFGPALGIQHPLFATPLIVALTAVTLSLCGIWYVRRGARIHPYLVCIPRPPLPSALLLCLLPFMSIFGAYMLNFFQIPTLLMLLVIVVALLAILAGFGKLISRDLYPLAIFVIAVSLLYHVSLVSTYLVGFDVQVEYNVANLVVSNGYWVTTIPSDYNAMLGLVILAPTFSQLCNIDLVWVFKLIYPLLFALVPVGVFRLFQKQTDDLTAFLSAFFFVSVFAFYAIMPQEAREEVAELFIVLILLLITDRKMVGWQKTAFFIVFGFALITSHYGLSYIFLFVLALAWVAMVLLTAQSTGKLRDFSSALLRRSEGKKTSETAVFQQLGARMVTPSLVLLFAVIALAWYMLTSGGSNINLLVHFGNQVLTNIGNTVLDPSTREGINIATTQQTPTRQITLTLSLVTQFFIVIGLALVVLKRRLWHIGNAFLAFAIAFFTVDVATLVVPNLATFLEFRFYQAILLLTAVFFVIGWTGTCRFFCDALKVQWTKRLRDAAFGGVAIFLAIFLVFNSGLIYELAHDNPTAISYDANIDGARFNEKELTSATWLLSHGSNGTVLSSDAVGTLLFLSKDPKLSSGNYSHPYKTFFADTQSLPQGSYVFLRSYVIEMGTIQNTYLGTEVVNLNSSVFYRTVLSTKSTIYDNGGSQIYE